MVLRKHIIASITATVLAWGVYIIGTIVDDSLIPEEADGAVLALAAALLVGAIVTCIAYTVVRHVETKIVPRAVNQAVDETLRHVEDHLLPEKWTPLYQQAVYDAAVQIIHAKVDSDDKDSFTQNIKNFLGLLRDRH